MEVARDVKRRIAQRVRKVILDYALPTGAADDANILNVQRVHKAAQIIVRLTGEVRGAH